MARQRTARPAAKPAPRAAPQQSRSSSTAAAPPQATPNSFQSTPMSQGPGLFGQMASTAAGVAIGSSIGHAVGGLFSGGSSEPQTAAPPSPAPQQQQWDAISCQEAGNLLRQCMLNNGAADPNACNHWMEKLRNCQP